MKIQNKLQLAVTLAMMCTAFMAQATKYYWIEDNGDGNWSDPANWTPSGVPGIYDEACFTYDQSAPFTVSFTNDAASKFSMGSYHTSKLVNVTFDLNGYTLTHTNSNIDAHRALEWTFLNGTFLTHPTARGFKIGYPEFDYVPKVTIGAGATHLHNGVSYIDVGMRTKAEMVIQDGGKLITQPSSGTESLRLGGYEEVPDYANFTAKMTVTGSGSVWSNFIGTIKLSTQARATAELNIIDNGTLVNNGGYIAVGDVLGANAFLNIASGGVVDLRAATSYLYIGKSGTGTVTVTGTGSTLQAVTNKSLYLGYSSGASQGTLIIEKGGLFNKSGGTGSMLLGYADNTTGKLIVRDGGEILWAGNFGHVFVGGGNTVGAIGEITVTGAGSLATLGEIVIGQNRGNALVTVSDGGTLDLYRTFYIGRINTNSVSQYSGLAKLVVSGAGSVVKQSALTKVELPDTRVGTTISLGVGGGGFSGWDDFGMLYYDSYGPGGKGLVVIEDSGRLEINGTLAIYSNSTLRVNGGRIQSGKIGLETNAVFNAILRSSDANGSALITASGEVRIWGTTLSIEKSVDFEPVPGDVYTLLAANTLHSTINRFSYDGAIVRDSDLITVEGTTFKVGYTENEVTLTVRNNGTLILVL